jgi:hypothetical protein
LLQNNGREERMKKVALAFISILLLTGCGNLTIQPSPTVIATVKQTETSTATPTRTPKPTSTPLPTSTATPALPSSIQFVFPNNITDKEKNELQVVVNQAYWFNVNMGCSLDGFTADFHKLNVGDASVGYFMLDVSDWNTNKSKDEAAISHEIVHVMCQVAFTKYSAMGAIDLRWLTEGEPNYFSTIERIQNTGMNSGVHFSNVQQQTNGMVENVRGYCDIPLSRLEPANAQELYPSYKGYAIADVATRLLIKTTPDGFSAIIKYYKLLRDNGKYKAFEDAFGRKTTSFYEQYQDECSKGFPTLLK